MQLPSVVRQIGTIRGDKRVYIEDYAYSYLVSMKEENSAFPLRAALYGHAFNKDGKQIFLIYGVSCVVGELERGWDQERIAEEYFREYPLIGYVNIYSSARLPGSKEGCYIFYDSNEAMERYLIDDRRRKEQRAEKTSEKLPGKLSEKPAEKRSGRLSEKPSEKLQGRLSEKPEDPREAKLFCGSRRMARESLLAGCKELGRRLWLLFWIMVAALAVTSINHYEDMREFTCMAVRAAQELR